MAAFIAQTSWNGEFSDDYFAQPVPDPASLGMPVDDDGSRGDPLLSDRSLAVTRYRPDVAAIAAASARVVIAVGEESRSVVTGRCAVATAELLGQEVTVFPSHHGGFMGGEFGYAGQPKAFAARLREVSTTTDRPPGRPNGEARAQCAELRLGVHVANVGVPAIQDAEPR